MPLVSIRTAAQITGRDRTTLNRAIVNGKLSATKSELGHYLIDPAELERVYGTLHIPTHEQPDALPSNAHSRTDPAVVELLREMLERERAAYERDRRAWDEERAFFRQLVDRQTEQVRLLTDQREREIARSPSLLARLFRKNA